MRFIYFFAEEGAVFRQSVVSGLVLAFVARVEAIEGKQGSQRGRFTFEHVEFESEEAGLPPVGYSDHVDHFSLKRGLRLKVAFKGGDVCSEAGLGRESVNRGAGERRPCRRLFREELALPWAVTGPRDLAPLARAAAARLSLVTRLAVRQSGIVIVAVIYDLYLTWVARGFSALSW